MMYRERYRTGDTIASLYQVKKVFGEGGFGEVYLVFHREREKTYVLKTIKETHFRSKEEMLAFRREAELWVMLGKHPNIVQAVSVRDFEGRLFIALEYIEPDDAGRNTLRDYFTGRPLELKQILLWAMQFCDGMNYARQSGIRCHRDIKPANIMITKERILKISDFGLAKNVNVSVVPDYFHDKLSPSIFINYEITEIFGGIKGTPPYMAPETFDLEGYKNADEVSDIYSFGIVLFEMITGGERPFNPGVNIFGVYEHLHKKEPVPRLENPVFPIVEKCLSKKREERYQSFRELRLDIEKYWKKFFGVQAPSPMRASETSEDIRDFAQALFELKHYEKAMQFCDKALSLEKRDHEAWNLRGRIMQAIGKLDEAEEAFDESIKIKPDYYAPWNNKGMICYQNGKTDEALRCFQKVITLRPDYREAWNNIGVCHQHENRINKAIDYYKKAVDLDPYYRDAWLNMGDCYILLKQYKQALVCYEQAEKIDPYDQYTLQNLEKIYRVLGLNDKAYFVRERLEGRRREGD